MPFTKGSVADALATILVTDTDADATAEDNVTGNSSGLVYCVYGKGAGQNAPVFIKTAYSANATAAQTVPANIYYVPLGKNVSYIADLGHAYTTGLSVWATVTAASATAQTEPSGGDMTIRILAT